MLPCSGRTGRDGQEGVRIKARTAGPALALPVVAATIGPVAAENLCGVIRECLRDGIGDCPLDRQPEFGNRVNLRPELLPPALDGIGPNSWTRSAARPVSPLLARPASRYALWMLIRRSGQPVAPSGRGGCRSCGATVPSPSVTRSHISKSSAAS